MRIGIKVVILWALSLSIAVADRVQTPEVWVVTDSAHPVNVPAGARHIKLDAAEAILSKLNAALPSDSKRAAMAATARIQSSSVLNRQLALAYQGVVDAWAIGVTAVPAVVVDRRYVVYGEPDVERALKLVSDFRDLGQ